MTATQKTKLLIWVTALALIMACVPTLATPSVPTVNPGAVNTFIAQTVIAAGTRTAAALPSLTPTPTLTPTEATVTASPTLTGVSSGGGGGSSSANYACKVTKVSPANGTRFNPRDDFDAVWTVKNIG